VNTTKERYNVTYDANLLLNSIIIQRTISLNIHSRNRIDFYRMLL